MALEKSSRQTKEAEEVLPDPGEHVPVNLLQPVSNTASARYALRRIHYVLSPFSPLWRWAALVLKVYKPTNQLKSSERPRAGKITTKVGERITLQKPRQPKDHTPRLRVLNAVRGCPVERSRFDIEDVFSCVPVLV